MLEANTMNSVSQFENTEIDQNDRGARTLQSLKDLSPLFYKLSNRPFIIALQELYKYEDAPDRDLLDKYRSKTKEKLKDGFLDFRDKIIKGYTYRMSYIFHPGNEHGKRIEKILFPDELNSKGVELTSAFKSTGMYHAITTGTPHSSFISQDSFGIPLLVNAEPVFDGKGRIIGGISFSNDISDLVETMQNLNAILRSESDKTLLNLGDKIDAELMQSIALVSKIKDEATFSKNSSDTISVKTSEVETISDRLKLLALNTAIEASKLSDKGRGISIIAKQMKEISEQTIKSLKTILDESKILKKSSVNVNKMTDVLKSTSTSLKNESTTLFGASKEISEQKDKLATLVKRSVADLTRGKDGLKKYFENL
jgi:hypothetical protein